MKNVEDVYPLSPLQQGMLFHSLLTPESEVYVNQSSCSLRGGLDSEVFRRTWQSAVDRHPILRTAFLWEGLDEPLQAVRRKVELPLEEQDWRHLDEDERVARLDALRLEERRKPLELAKAPLLRLVLVRLGEDRYELIWTFHHILLDGWSTPLLYREIFALYQALSLGEAPALAPVRPYRDYIEWLAGQDMDEAESFWRRDLAGFTAPTPLVVDRAPEGAVAEDDEVMIRLSSDLTERLQRLARRHKVTLNTLCLGSWALLLSRYGGQPDVLFGMVVSGRPVDLPGVESILGLFINTLPARVRVDKSGEVAAWFQGLQARLLELRQYEYSPLAQVGKWSEVAPPAPLFESLFVFENYPVGEVRGESSWELEVLDVKNVESTGYPLNVSAWTFGDLFLRTTFDKARFDGATCARLLGHLQRILEQVAEGAVRLEEVSILSLVEREQIMAWNDTPVPYDLDVGLHQIFETQANRAPGALALIYEDVNLTYRDLDRRANAMAYRLADHGCEPQSRVGVFMERSIDLVVALYGILKAGAAYVPLDPEHPAARVTYQVENARLAAIITQPSLSGRLPEVNVACLVVDPESAAGPAESCDARPAVRVYPENTAYVIYTSGSTGRPKGVAVSHRSIVNRLLWMQDIYGLDDTDRVLQKTPFSFDVSVWEFFWPLLSGACLVVARPGGHRDSAYMARQIIDHDVTILHFVPSMLQMFLREPTVGACRSLRDVMASGEALSRELVKRFHTRLSANLHNLYGPTEAAVDVTSWACRRDDEDRMVPIGRPIANTQIHLLDPRLSPVPVGVGGELCIGGVNLAQGYVHKAAQTAERFIPDALGGGSGARLYRTGDLARYRADGAIEFLGRIDFQVKVRGFRIELGEIEASLVEHPGVGEAAVIVDERDDGHRRLVGYYVPAAAVDEVSVEDLPSFLGRRLPEYMVPPFFVRLEALPLTPSGKLDRRALPRPEVARAAARVEFVAPQGAREKAMAEIFAAVLGAERVGRNDSFFTLGGDSILSLRVLSEARERGLELTLEQIFQHPVLSDLVREMSAPESEPVLETSPFSLISAEDRERMPDSVEDAYPLAYMQAGMLFHSELGASSSLYHNTNSLHLRARFDRRKLETALAALVRCHPLLRTSFDLSSFSQPLQLVHREARVPVHVEDLRHLTAEEQEQELDRWFDEERQRLFEWGRAPLLRYTVHLRGEDRFQLSWSEHHAIVDGWSVASMNTELTHHYVALLNEGDEAPALAEPPSSFYRDYVALERHVLASEDARRFWIEELDDATRLELPRPASSDLETSGRIETQDVHLRPGITGDLQKLALDLGVPVKSVLLAAHLRVLSLLGGQTDLTTGLVSNGRLEKRDGERALGLYLNTLPLRMRLSGGTWRDLVRDTFEAELRSLARRRFPLAEIQRITGGRALFDVVFTFLHFHVMQSYAGLADDIERLDSRANLPTNFPLATYVQVNPMNGEISISLDYDIRRLGAGQMRSVADYYKRAVEALVRDPGARYETCELLSPAERHQILEQSEGDRIDFPPVCLDELFEQAVERHSQLPAMIFEGEELTYGELNGRINQLAHYLRRLGVGPEVRVGVCLERSTELVISLMAVLKAGGAYVPLDPTYPAERFAFMVADAGLRVVLTFERWAPKLGGQDLSTVLLDRERATLDNESTDNPARLTTPDHLAYVIYTSGSTGKPKGAMNVHRAVVNRLCWAQETYGLAPGDRVMQKTPFSFDVSVWEFFWTLFSGACLVVARPEGHKDPAYLTEVINDLGVTTMHFVPSMLRAFLDQPGVETCVGLRRVLASGEALTLDLQRRFFELLGAELHNLYGPTEAAIDVTYWPCDRDQIEGSVPIGVAIGNVRNLLLDRHMNLAPAGVQGELHIGGVAPARGYQGRPALTAEYFVPDPETAEPGARLYKSGDLSRTLADGNIEYLGRLDHQVKIRGLRIELGEIEATLASHPAINEAVVLAEDNGAGDTRLVAFLVPDEASALPVRRLLRLEEAGAYDKDRLYRLPDGWPLFHLNPGETDFLYQEIFELRSYLRHGVTLHEGDVVFDVGANVGLFALFASRQVGEVGRIFCFEPIPAVHRLLEQNAELWGAPAQVFACGLSNVSAEVEFTYYPHVSILSGQFADSGEEREAVRAFLRNEQGGELSRELLDELLDERLQSERVSCQVRTVSEVMEAEGVDRIDLLKVDVEKGELEVLAGIDDEDWPKIRQVVVEVHDIEGRRESVRRRLEERGFEVGEEQDESMLSTGLYNLYARRTGTRPGRPAAPREVWKDGAELLGAVRRTVGEKLPDYMVPSTLVMLDELPLNPNGKLDRRALPRPGQARPSLTRDYVPPRNETESQLVEIWQEVLSLDRVGIEDNLFEIGGHSLLATQIIVQIRETFQVDLRMRTLLEAPTVALLAVAVVQRQAELADDAALESLLSEIEQAAGDELPEHVGTATVVDQGVPHE